RAVLVVVHGTMEECERRTEIGVAELFEGRRKEHVERGDENALRCGFPLGQSHDAKATISVRWPRVRPSRSSVVTSGTRSASASTTYAASYGVIRSRSCQIRSTRPVTG